MKRWKLILTRQAEACQPWQEALLGVEILPLPLVDYRPVKTPLPERLEAFDFLVFTSPRGVRYFFENLPQKYSLNGKKLFCVGEKTAQAWKGYNPSLTPSMVEQNAETLLERLQKVAQGLQKGLYPCSRDRLPYLEETLKKAGVTLIPWVLYEPQSMPYTRKELQALLSKADGILFFAPSQVKAFCRYFPENKPLRGLRVFALGKTTYQACPPQWEVQVLPQPTPEGLKKLLKGGSDALS